MTKRQRTSAHHSIFRAVIIIVVSLLVGGSIYSINASRLAHNDMPMPFGYGVSVVLTGSMDPAIRTDDLIIVHKQDEYNINDVVVYRTGNEMIVHRIIDIDGDVLTTKGDANNTADDPITTDAIKGSVVCNVHMLGRMVTALRSPIGIMIVIALAITLMEMSMRRERSQDDAEIEKIKEEIRRLKEGVLQIKVNR